MDKTYKIIGIVLSFSMSQSLCAETIAYEFEINQEQVNITGKPVSAVTINHQIPAPQITATVGDTLKVTVTNKMPVESSIHWHGVLLPNKEDGVPYLTTPPIAAGSSHTYEFPVIHAGTYWYHSHSGFQEQQGVYGPITFLPQEEPVSYTHNITAVLSDWTNEHPNKVMANLKRDGDYYAVKKDTVQSWDKVIAYGAKGLAMRLKSAWSRMGPMDISDVGYDAFLINGQQSSHFNQAKKGDRIRLRIINASASTYQIVQFSGGPMTIIAADGMNVEPIEVENLRVAIAETYDVFITVPDKAEYEFRASSEDGTGYASLYIGQGERVQASTVKKPNIFASLHQMRDSHMPASDTHAQMAHSKKPMNMPMDRPIDMPMNMLMAKEYKELRSPAPTKFASDSPKRDIELNLTGNMDRYIWTFNNKTLSESESIKINNGEVVQVHLNNKTMMHHPVHLHGHFFRVLNGHGEYSPLKHTVNIQPMSNVTIEFKATEEKDWFFHCHNLYHMKSGMARVFSYSESSTYSDRIRDMIAHDTDWYHTGSIAPLSNMIIGEFRLSNTRHAVHAEIEHNYKDSYELSLSYERSINRFLDFYAGYHIEKDSEDREMTAIGGAHYILPMLVDLDIRYNSKNALRAEFSSDLQLSKHINYDWMWNTDDEYRHTLNYEFNKSMIFNINYDSDDHFGFGLVWTF